MRKSHRTKPWLYGVLIATLAAPFGTGAEVCEDAWTDSPAASNGDCEANVRRISSNSTDGTAGNCSIAAACRAYAKIIRDDDDDDSDNGIVGNPYLVEGVTEWRAVTNERFSHTPEDTDDLTVCLGEHTGEALPTLSDVEQGYYMILKAGCDSDETTAADARSDGLPELDND